MLFRRCHPPYLRSRLSRINNFRLRNLWPTPPKNTTLFTQDSTTCHLHRIIMDVCFFPSPNRDLPDSSKGGASITSTEALLQSPDQKKVGGEKLSKTQSFLKKLKEDNEKRKEKVQHVSHEEAERMTGYGENTRKESDGKEKRNKVPSLTTLLF